MRRIVISLLAVFGGAGAWADRTEVETYEGAFTNPFFDHQLEFTTCCFEFVQRDEFDSISLHLVPNSVVIHWQTEPEEVVTAVRIDMLDFEGGFVGSSPTSAFIARGASGDFVFRNAAAIGFDETLEITEHDIGLLNGLPLGPIVEVDLQAANEGNSVFPGEIGAYVDNLTADIVVRPLCPGDVDGDNDADLADLATLLSNFGLLEGATRAQGDLDGDAHVDLSDLATLLSDFGCH